MTIGGWTRTIGILSRPPVALFGAAGGPNTGAMEARVAHFIDTLGRARCRAHVVEGLRGGATGCPRAVCSGCPRA